VLGRGNRWLDYRQLSRLIADSQATADAPDLVSQYEQLRYRGEGEGLEFKEQTPAVKDKDRMLKTVAAFANGNGGVILFGIEDGTGAVKGLQVDPARETDRLTDMIRTVLVPQPTFKILSADVEGKLVMSLTVESGNNPPYGIHPEKPEYYVRRGATTFPARQDEVRSLAQPPATSPYGAIPNPFDRIRGLR
jgi:predicted HTH transcriptional regulator